MAKNHEQTVQVHGTGHYNQRPNIFASIGYNNIVRNGNTIYCTLSATTRWQYSASTFGHTFRVIAQLDNGPEQLLIDKSTNSPSRWGAWDYSNHDRTLSSVNTGTSCTLKIYFESNCTCRAGKQLVWSTTMSAPPAVKRTLSLSAVGGIASFTGAGQYDDGTYAVTNAVASTGYTLSHYTGTDEDGSTKTWDMCKGHTTHSQRWRMVRDRSISVIPSPNTYTISYDANGGSGYMAAQSVLFDNWVTPSSNQYARSGYRFTGWNTQPNGTGTWHNSGWTYTTAGNMTLYAQWQRISYTVSYDANGGAGAPGAQTKYDGVTLTLTTATPSVPKSLTVTFNPNGGSVNPGHSTRNCGFLRWNTQPNGSGTNYSAGGAYTANVGAVLYAIWSGITVALPTPSRTNCNFVGWFTAVDGGNQVNNSTAYYQNTTVYAKWDYLVKYNLSGGFVGDEQDYGSPSIPDSIKHHNSNLKLTTLVPSKEGLQFKGWSESPNGQVMYGVGGTYTKNQPITLYAIYDVPEFTVTFDLKGGTYKGGGALVQKIKYGHDATLPNNPVWDNHVFKGWVGEYRNVTSDRTIYALWNGCPVWIMLETDTTTHKKEWKSYVEYSKGD